MRPPRLAILAVALVVCAWFVLGTVQTRDQDQATALMARSGRPAPAVTARILALLDAASTLNPDRAIALLRSQAQTRAGRSAAAVASALAVTRAEPQNANAWFELGFAAGRTRPRLGRLASERIRQLVPPVPAAP
jgi:hypothetical protein